MDVQNRELVKNDQDPTNHLELDTRSIVNKLLPVIKMSWRQ